MGGQFGSEGKGKVSAQITLDEGIDLCVRCGGPNSGHSFSTKEGVKISLRQLPVGVVASYTRLLLPAGALVDLSILFREINQFGLMGDPSRVGIDRNAMILESFDSGNENGLNLQTRISSTLSGTGSAVSRRVMRGENVRLAKDIPELENFLTDVAQECNKALDQRRKVLIEGTQGFGLSLYHSPYYPKATARDTSAAGFLSEVGLSPRQVDEIVVVFRTFPIRVAGEQAGPLKDEIDWNTVQRESGYPTSVAEYTTVTKKIRRVARFDFEMARWSVERNRPTKIAVMGFDYLNHSDLGKTVLADFSQKSLDFVNCFERMVGKGIDYFGTGPALEQFCHWKQGREHY